jgi:hypothetical protein
MPVTQYDQRKRALKQYAKCAIIFLSNLFCNFDILMEFEYSPNFDVDYDYFDDFNVIESATANEKREEVCFLKDIIGIVI